MQKQASVKARQVNGRRDRDRTDRAQIFADASFTGLYTMSAKFETLHLAPHTHDELMIGTIEEGTQGFLRDRKTHYASAGTLSIVNPGDVHTGEPAYGCSLAYRAIYIPVQVLLQVQMDLRLSKTLLGFQKAVIHDPLLWTALKNYHDALECGELAIIREAHLFSALQRLTQNHGEVPKSCTSDAPALYGARLMRELLHSLRNRSPSVQALATAAEVSPFRAIRSFYRAFGATPHAYLLTLKVQRSQELIRSGVAIRDVALEVGFTDQAHLTRHFKRMVGVTPGAYQAAFRRRC